MCFKDPINQWLASLRYALRDGSDTTSDLGRGLKRLVGIRNLSDQGLIDRPGLVLDPTRPRSLPASITSSGLSVFIPDDSFDIYPYAEGEQLFARIHFRGHDEEPDEEKPSFPIDLNIARESANCLKNTNNQSLGEGFTEISPSNFARIERARAQLLVKSRQVNQAIALIKNESGSIFSIGSKGANSETPYEIKPL